MSITNYFGKPRAKYVPYKSPYTFDNLPKNRYDVFYIGKCGDYNEKYTIHTEIGVGQHRKIKQEYKQVNECDDITHSLTKIAGMKRNKVIFHTTQNGTNINEFSVYHHGGQCEEVICLEDINAMFNNFLKEIIEWIEQPIWKLFKINPTTNFMQVLILKLSDVDQHVVHLEKMVASLCDDNTLLANRIKALEDRLSRQAEIPLAEPIAEHITVAEAIFEC